MYVACYFKLEDVKSGTLVAKRVNAVLDLKEPEGWYSVSPETFTDEERTWMDMGKILYVRHTSPSYLPLRRLVKVPKPYRAMSYLEKKARREYKQRYGKS